MASAKTIIECARQYIGVAEKYNNNVIFNTEYYGHSVNGSAYAWCAVFIWYVFKQAGASKLYYGGGKTAYCPTLMSFYKGKRQWYTKPQVGDIVFYNFESPKGSTAQHVGIVTGVSSTYITAIEGNTSSSNNTNGGEVRERKRSLSYCLGFARPSYSADATKQETSTMYTGTVNTKTSNLNVRTGTGSTYSIASAFPEGLPKGTKVCIEKEQNGFGKLAGLDLWVSTSYIKKG